MKTISVGSAKIEEIFKEFILDDSETDLTIVFTNLNQNSDFMDIGNTIRGTLHNLWKNLEKFKTKNLNLDFSKISTLTAVPTIALASCFLLADVILPEGIETLEKEAFENNPKLARVSVPETLSEIGEAALPHNLSEISFNGTQGQWNAIKKHKSWYKLPVLAVSGNITIHCTDGDIDFSY